MNPRIIKEVRLLLWPWCLVIFAALLPFVSSAINHFNELSAILCTIGFFGGIPFLAAFSLGGEFQQRTLPLLLGQPVGRVRLWTEKQAVLLPAVLMAVLIYSLSWPRRSELNTEALVIVGAWLLVTISSAPFWTLMARSTLGGLVLGQVAQFALAALMINLGLRIFGPEPSAAALHLAEAISAVICFCYAGLMLWLGRRKLIRFQATGGVAGEDLLMAGPRMMPASLADLLRCRANSPTLNLIRKELRLLRPLWLVMLLFLACWACVVVTVRLMPPTEDWRAWREVLPGVAIAFYVPLAVILAGCLSLGEERSSGTHTWHLTLPVSVRRQWFIKLVMALGAGVFSAMVIPFLAVLAGQGLLGSPFGAEFKWNFNHAGWPEYLVPGFIAICASFPAFWCACSVNGAVRAALWVLPAMCLLCFVAAGGIWAAQSLRLGETAVGLMTVIVAKFQLSPRALTEAIYSWRESVLILPTLLVALLQSYWLFRKQPDDRILPMLRRLLPLALVSFFGAVACMIFVSSVWGQYDSILVTETRAGIKRLYVDKDMDDTRSLKLTAEDLAKVSPMSELTRQWLRNASIMVVPVKAGKTQNGRPQRDEKPTDSFIWVRPRANYVATIHFPNGTEYPINISISRARNEPRLDKPAR